MSEKESPPSKKSVPEWLIVLQWGLALIQANLVVAGAFEYRFGYPTGTILYNGALALIVCSYLTFTHTWREAGFRRPQSARSLLWFVLLLLPEVYWQHGPIYASLGPIRITCYTWRHERTRNQEARAAANAE